MGYTHYWDLTGYSTFSKEVIKDIQQIFDDYKGLIEYKGIDSEKGEPIVNRDTILFNGVGEDRHETFYINLCDAPRGFCKTGRMPYDLPVCEVLLVLKHHYRDNFDLSSDGFCASKEKFLKEELDENWNDALNNVSNKFGYSFTLIPQISGSEDRKYYSFQII